MTLFWKLLNPFTRPLAGYAPWWVLLQTTGRRTGQLRLTPLASSPFDGQMLCLLSVYGDRSAFVKNIRAHPVVRVKRRGSWFDGKAEVLEPTPETVARLGRYSRSALLRFASEPMIVKVTTS